MGEPEIGAGGVLTVLAIAAVGLLIVILPFWVIFRKAGLSPFLSLLVIIPYIGPLLVWLILAFSRWPTTED